MPRARAPSESDPVGIGFIGCGDIATLHADAVRATEGAKLVGLWNYKEEDVSAGGHAFTAAGRAAEWDCTRYASAEALCADALVEAVYVLTTCETHRVYVEMALRAGKHVMVEKPVGASVSEIEAMAALAEERGLVLMPAHNYIYEESVRRIHSMVDTAALGRVTLVSIFYNIHHPEPVAARCQARRSLPTPCGVVLPRPHMHALGERSSSALRVESVAGRDPADHDAPRLHISLPHWRRASGLCLVHEGDDQRRLCAKGEPRRAHVPDAVGRAVDTAVLVRQ